MTWQIEEKHDSQRLTIEGVGTGKRLAQARFTYLAFWGDSAPKLPIDAIKEVADFAPDYIDQDGAPTNEPTAPEDSETLKRVRAFVEQEPKEGFVFQVVVTYALPDDSSEFDTTFQFTTLGSSKNITQSLKTVAVYDEQGVVSGKTDLEGGGPINFDGQTVHGTEVVVPQYLLTIRRVFATSEIPANYNAWVFFLTGKTNNAPFQGFKAGEVLFLGGEGNKRVGEDRWEFAFQFACSPNITSGGGPEPWDKGIKVGDIEVDKKEGWEYLWAKYGQKIDDELDDVVQVPVAAYVEKVYDSGDFSQLNIDPV